MDLLVLRIESVAVGDELLDGRITDGNTRVLGDALAPLGLCVTRSTSVPDDVEAIADAVLEAATRADIVVTSGGLGPTTDDLTAAGIARAAGCGLRLDEEVYRSIRARFEARGLHMPDNNRRQAELPSLGERLGNDVGVAPGFVTPVGGAQVFSLPGVPREYRWMVEHRVLPTLEQCLGAKKHVERRTLRCLGITESALGAALEPLQRAHPDVLVQYRTSFPENHARIVISGDESAAVARRADALLAEARDLVGGAAYGDGDEPLAQRVVEALSRSGATLAVAESCTGGLLAKAITDIAGASRVFVGGIVAYANQVKRDQLGVAEAALDQYGAVSEEVAAAMASGASEKLGAHYALSVTGVAGPGGGTDDKPVGTVCFGMAGPRGVQTKRRQLMAPDRTMIRELSVAVALRWLLVTLEGASLHADGPIGA